MRLSIKNISSQFVLISSAIVILALVPFTYYTISNYSADREEDATQSLKQQEASLLEASQGMTRFIARISPSAVMGQDMFLLKQFADEALSDSNFLQISITDATGNPLLDQKNTKSNALTKEAWADTAIKVFTSDIITSKELLGVEQKVGTISIRTSLASLQWKHSQQMDELHGEIASMTLFLISFVVLLIGVLSIAIFSALKVLVMRPIDQVSLRIHDIAEGDGDLTQRLNFQKENEMGALAKGIDIFLGKLQQLIRNMIGRFTNLDSNLGVVSKGAEQMVAAASIMGNKSQQASTGANAVNVEITQLVGTMGSLQDQIQSISKVMDEFRSTVGDVTRSATMQSQKAQEADTLTETASTIVGGLNDSVRAIVDILATIKAVSDQTRLLALNASIEAASAGDAGKGFAVVAAEVKDLARRTAQSTESIQSLVSKVEEQMTQAVDAISIVRGEVREMKNASLTVSAAMEEQTASVKHVAERIQQVNGLTATVNQSLGKSDQLTRSVTRNILDLGEVVKNVEQEIRKTQEEIQQAATVSGEVKGLLGKFRI